MKARKRAKAGSGSLLWSGKGWSGRYLALVDGVTIRRCVSLGTDNKTVAAAKLARLVAGEDSPASVQRPETFEQAARRVVGASTIRTKSERLSRLVRYAFGQLGGMFVVDIKARHIKAVLVAAQAELGGPTTTVGHLLHDISSVLADLWRDEVLAENPAKRVRIEAAKVTSAPRVVLSDAEFERFVSSPAVDAELRTMALTSRCLGGMRSSDLHAWNWEHIDTSTWASAFVPRKKTDKAQAGAARHAIPELLVAPLQAWWASQKRPLQGPVFPCHHGPRAGERKQSRTYAKALRRALWAAGVVRPLPGFDPKNPKRELCQLQQGDEHTSRVDFHSFRRAYATAAARAGLNVQQAMQLADHSSASTHMRYVRATDVLVTPKSMLPKINAPGLGAAKPSDLASSLGATSEPLDFLLARMRQSHGASAEVAGDHRID